MDQKITSKIAIVTGGSTGIGYAVVKKMVKEKIQVIAADIKPPKENNENVHYKKCDVGSGKDIDELYNWVSTNFGIPDILVLNAGQGIQEKLTEGDPDKWQNIVHINLMGPLRCIRAFVPEMVERKKPDRPTGGGNVVFISSVSANNPHQYGGIYSATKTALEVIAETLRLETLPHINVTVVSPGIVETNFFDNQVSGNSSIEEMGMGAIAAEEIAEDVFYAISKKNGTSINKIVTRPLKQQF